MDSASIIQLLQSAGHTVRHQTIDDENWAAVFAHAADFVIVAGGDGTVKRAVLQAPPALPLAILPLGTANNIAHSLGIRGSHEDLVARWDLGRTRPLDLGTAHGPWGRMPFVEGVGIGAVTETAWRIECGEVEKPEGDDDPEREIAWARGVLRAVLSEAAPCELAIGIDGEARHEAVAFLEIANIRYIGPRLALAPAAQPHDGKLDIVWAPDHARGALCDWLTEATSAANDAPVRTARGTQVSIRNLQDRIGIDDTFWPPDRREIEPVPLVEVTLEPGARRVLVS